MKHDLRNRMKILRIIFLLFPITGFFLILTGTHLSAILENDHNRNVVDVDPFFNANTKSSVPKFVKTKLIVKYKDSVTKCVHCLLKSHGGFRQATTDHSETLDELHAKYEIISALPVFRTETEENEILASIGEISTTSLMQYHRQKLEVVKARFPNRTRRIPKDVLLPDLHHIYILTLPDHIDIVAALAELRRDPHIEYAQPDYLVKISFVPNDPYYRSSGSWGQNYDDLWGLKADKLDLGSAWDVTQGEGIVVGVVDTGLDYKHEDIAANVWKNRGEIASNRRDDDRNGFVDDIRGWDFITCSEFGGTGCASPKKPDNDPLDDHFHGTHVSGTIAAIGNNRTGIIGVAPRARIMPLKAFNKQGVAPLSEAAAAIVYASKNGADVINNSWGCGFCPTSPVNEDAVRAAHGLGAVVVFSAGNAGNDSRTVSPQNMHNPKPIVVAASDQDDEPTFFTNFGAVIDVAAPGGGKDGSIPDLTG